MGGVMVCLVVACTLVTLAQRCTLYACDARAALRMRRASGRSSKAGESFRTPHPQSRRAVAVARSTPRRAYNGNTQRGAVQRCVVKETNELSKNDPETPAFLPTHRSTTGATATCLFDAVCRPPPPPNEPGGKQRTRRSANAVFVDRLAGRLGCPLSPLSQTAFSTRTTTPHVPPPFATATPRTARRTQLYCA